MRSTIAGSMPRYPCGDCASQGALTSAEWVARTTTVACGSRFPISRATQGDDEAVVDEQLARADQEVLRFAGRRTVGTDVLARVAAGDQQDGGARRRRRGQDQQMSGRSGVDDLGARARRCEQERQRDTGTDGEAARRWTHRSDIGRLAGDPLRR
jgi:hypothetical protein